MTVPIDAFTNVRWHLRVIALLIVTVSGVCGCGGGSASSSAPAAPPAAPSGAVITVTVTPNSATILRGATQSFAAAVTGTTNSAVIWSVQESVGGTVDNTGRYTAPQDRDGTFHVVATSQADSTAKGTAAVVVVATPQIRISPGSVTLRPGEAQTFVATVAGPVNTGVTWTIREPAGGLINGTGFYAAPKAEGFYHVVATSVADTTLTASSTISVTNSQFVFWPRGSLQGARVFHSATLLTSGKVLVAGGSHGESDLACVGGIASAELYDPFRGSFAPTGGLTAGRYHHTATLLQNGKVLITGGFGDISDCQRVGVQPQNTAELYDPVAGSFTKAGNMSIPRGWHTATLLTDGKVLVVGGDQGRETASASAELYDPNTGSFIQTGSMAVARFRHTATLLKNGKVLIVGGATTTSSNPTSSAELYDPATGTFTVTGNMTMARQEHTATPLDNGKVLIVGGESLVTGGAGLQPTATAEIYDPSTGSFLSAGSMGEARSSHTATLLPDRTVLITGGDDSTAELYDPTTNSFSTTGGMQVGRSGHSATLLSDGGGPLVVGGGATVPIATAEAYGSIWDY